MSECECVCVCDCVVYHMQAAERREEVQILISDAQSVLSTIKNKKQVSHQIQHKSS